MRVSPRCWRAVFQTAGGTASFPFFYTMYTSIQAFHTPSYSILVRVQPGRYLFLLFMALWSFASCILAFWSLIVIPLASSLIHSLWCPCFVYPWSPTLCTPRVSPGVSVHAFGCLTIHIAVLGIPSFLQIGPLVHFVRSIYFCQRTRHMQISYRVSSPGSIYLALFSTDFEVLLPWRSLYIVSIQ